MLWLTRMFLLTLGIKGTIQERKGSLDSTRVTLRQSTWTESSLHIQ
jgi:hypothetical protein